MPEPDALNAVKPDPEPGLMESTLLRDLIRSREQLARSIARNNLELRSEQIATAVNRILFPLLFLRIAHDRGLLPGGLPEDIRNFLTVPQLTGALAPYAEALYPDDPPDTSRPPGTGRDLIIEDRVIRGAAEAFLSTEEKSDCRTMQTGEIARIMMQYLSRTIRRSAAH